MKKSRRSVIGGLGAIATTVVAVLALPGVANAAALPTETVSTTAQAPPATTTWDFSTTSRYWSIVGVYSDSDYDVDLSASGTKLASSTYGAGSTDFIAVDSNDARRPLGRYRATVRRFAGSANFAIEQMQGRIVTSLPVPANDGVSGPSDPDITFVAINSIRLVSISDIFMTAGDAFWVNTTSVDSNVFFLESDPASPSTFVRSRSSAVSSAGGRVVDGCTIYTARLTGWHAIAVVTNAYPAATDPPGGSAYALHRYSPSRPTSCPIKNFPGPTP